MFRRLNFSPMIAPKEKFKSCHSDQVCRNGGRYGDLYGERNTMSRFPSPFQPALFGLIRYFSPVARLL